MNIGDIARKLGSLGGKKSVKSRLEGKSKEEKSALMRKVRMGNKKPTV